MLIWERDAVIQAIGSTKSDTIKENKEVINQSPVAAEQNWAYLDKLSKVVLIASVTSEEGKTSMLETMKVFCSTLTW